MSISTPTPTTTEAASDFVNSRPFEWLARAGFVARGLVYGIIGLLALKLAIGSGGKATDQEGAMRTLAHQPLGRTMLVALAVGLAGYAMWRFTRAAYGRGPEGSDKGFDRLAALASGLVYAAFFVLAIKILLDTKGGRTAGAKATTAGVLDWPAGPVLVGLAGLIFVGVAGYQCYKGVTQSFLHDSKTEEMRPEVKHFIARIGTIGHVARAVVFGLVGAFLVKAAIDYNAKAAIGLDGALAKLAHQTYGHLLLGMVACGLIAFAMYSISDARYRRI